MAGHLSGGKFTGSHTTVIPAAEKLLRIVEKMPEVKKIVLGVIKNVKCTPGVKVVEESPGFLLVTIRGNSSIQQIRIYLDDPVSRKKVEQVILAN